MNDEFDKALATLLALMPTNMCFIATPRGDAIVIAKSSSGCAGCLHEWFGEHSSEINPHEVN